MRNNSGKSTESVRGWVTEQAQRLAQCGGPAGGMPPGFVENAVVPSILSLSDDDALKVPALFPRYERGHVYAQGDRVLWQGALYKAISGHTATADDPTADPQHWTKVASPASGDTPAEWVSGKSYAKGNRVTKYGSVYESLMDDNTIEPGTFGSESAWKQLTA